ncbi:hypothetical protein CRM22_004786 [Opisthorchis felineus]|uniref:Uncharacterized protein n=1 Tax=Opisthorchis felineus TaxID=147828 RepID=A0A4S2LUE1_OPIFE|nr:hypothetical protein CRM22_004786 [Opisthorchis felineus]
MARTSSSTSFQTSHGIQIFLVRLFRTVTDHILIHLPPIPPTTNSPKTSVIIAYRRASLPLDLNQPTHHPSLTTPACVPATTRPCAPILDHPEGRASETVNLNGVGICDTLSDTYDTTSLRAYTGLL